MAKAKHFLGEYYIRESNSRRKIAWRMCHSQSGGHKAKYISGAAAQEEAARPYPDGWPRNHYLAPCGFWHVGRQPIPKNYPVTRFHCAWEMELDAKVRAQLVRENIGGFQARYNEITRRWRGVFKRLNNNGTYLRSELLPQGSSSVSRLGLEGTHRRSTQ